MNMHGENNKKKKIVVKKLYAWKSEYALPII